MEDDEWQDLSDALLGDAAEFETAGSAGSEEQLLMPGAHTAMSMDDWDTLANELLDGSVAPDEQDDDEFRGVLPPREQGRNPLVEPMAVEACDRHPFKLRSRQQLQQILPWAHSPEQLLTPGK